MIAKILGFDLVNFPNDQTGELISGTRAYYELLRDDPNDNEYGNTCGSVFVKNCIPLSVGGEYEVILKPSRKNGVLSYVIAGFSTAIPDR